MLCTVALTVQLTVLQYAVCYSIVPPTVAVQHLTLLNYTIHRQFHGNHEAKITQTLEGRQRLL